VNKCRFVLAIVKGLPQSGRAYGWDWSKITMYQDADEWRTT